MNQRSAQLPRVAIFADSFLEVDGAAMTCRRLVDYAKETGLPMICVHAGPKAEIRNEGSIRYLSVRRSRLSIPLDHDLKYDPIFSKNYAFIDREIKKFKPDVIHITGLNDVSIVGTLIGWTSSTPIMASWHTNVHEFASQRLKKGLSFLGSGLAHKAGDIAEFVILKGMMRYFRIPKLTFAPNQELVDALRTGTGREARLMARGVDTVAFSPDKRKLDDGILRVGFAGRLRPEKNVELLIGLERYLVEGGLKNFRFLIVGEGSQRAMLEKNLRFADFTGFIENEDLSDAYANMDLFVFPSETDAFGNVVQEALASGVPAVVTDKGGPKFIVEHGVTGFVASSKADFFERTAELLGDPHRLKKMKIAARHAAIGRTWVSIFDRVFEGYSDVAKIRVASTKGPAKPAQFLAGDSPEKLGSVSSRLLFHPIREVLLKWNWKSALLSALLRSPIFFTAYLAQKQGLWIATGAMLVQFAFRTFFGGINGAILQSFSKVTPVWHAFLTIPIVLAVLSHLAEFLIQSVYDAATGSQGKGGAVLFSASVSVISAVFNLFAMRRGLLLVRDESSQSLGRDLKQMPMIALEFLALPLVWTWKRARRA